MGIWAPALFALVSGSPPAVTVPHGTEKSYIRLSDPKGWATPANQRP